MDSAFYIRKGTVIIPILYITQCKSVKSFGSVFCLWYILLKHCFCICAVSFIHIYHTKQNQCLRIIAVYGLFQFTFSIFIIIHIIINSAAVTMILCIFCSSWQSSFQITGSVCFHIPVQICPVDLDSSVISCIFAVGLFKISRSFLIGIHGQCCFSRKEVQIRIHFIVFCQSLAVFQCCLIILYFEISHSSIRQNIFF